MTTKNTPSGREIWAQVKEMIIGRNQANKPLQMWFEPTKLIGAERQAEGLVFKIGVPTELHKYWISQNLLNLISADLAALLNESFRLDLIVTGEEPGSDGSDNWDTAGGEGTSEASPINPASSAATSSPGEFASVSTPGQPAVLRECLNRDYTFSTFVVGRNNEFAHAACFNISENPGADSYNPLFICGPTGMGKTHLLNAVGNHIKEKFPQLRTCYGSAEKFLNECVSSIRRGEMEKFRLKYREKCDLLLMDDIQVLGRGEAVQEEFFHTLNDYIEKGRQVVVASDRMPKDIHGLHDRIRTRLEWGLIADIQMPDIETRVAILKYKAERKGILIPPDVINYIGRISKRSIRELEGNLNKIKMFSELQGLNITIDLARRVLAGHDDSTTLTVEDIQRITAEHFNIRLPELKSKSRAKPLVVARQMAMFMVKKHLDKSLVEIGRAFGGKDHTTVINALRRMEDQLSKNSDLRKDFDDIQMRIHNLTGV